jgi:hypothetical protein
MKVSHKKVEIDSYFIEDSPELIYFIESGYKDRWIQLSIDPIYGNTHTTITTESKEYLENKLRSYIK